MKLAKLAVLAIAFILVSAVSVKAQKNFLKDADRAFDSREYFSAIELYKKAYAKEAKKEKKAMIIFQTAECYRLINDYKNSEQWYKKAIEAKYPDPIAILHLANAKKSMGKYDEALVEFNNYKKAVPSDPRGEDGAKSCELAAKWKTTPSRYKIENLAQINSKQQDYSPAYMDKKYSTIYFTSTREGTTGDSKDNITGQSFSDIFESKVDKNGKWSTPTPVAKPLNEEFNDGSCILNKKGTTVFFTRCEVEKNKLKECQLMTSTKKGNTWEAPTKLPFDVDSFTFSQPALSVDEQILVFGSNMPGGYGSMDLWASIYNKTSKEWGAPVNLGPSINTQGYESFPYINDEGALFFSSDGHLGMGGLDIFKAEKKGDAKWANVTNMQFPLNSASDDFGIIYEGKKNRGYLSSNRADGKGSDDIYLFYMPPLLLTIEGVVTNCDFPEESVQNVTMRLVGADGTTAEVKTDKSGYYKFAENGEKRYVAENTSYVLSTVVDTTVKTSKAKYGFLNNPTKAKETTVGLNESKVFKHDFCLIPIQKGIRFPEVLYDLNMATLRPESKDSLNYLYETLINNPGIVVQLESHTDFRGSDAANQVLSQERAKSCVDYLISKGINPARLTPKGFGEKSPLEIKDPISGKVLYKLDEKYITSLKTVEEQEAAHQKNRRTVFTVLRKDFVDPNAPKEQPKTATPEEGEEE